MVIKKNEILPFVIVWMDLEGIMLISKINQSEKDKYAWAGIAKWIEHKPVNQRVASLIPSQGTCLGCQRGLQ